MSFKSALILGLITLAWILASCTDSHQPTMNVETQSADAFYSRDGRQVEVTFNAAIITPYKSVEEFNTSAEINQKWLEDSYIPKTLMFLQGPMAYRGIGSRRISASIKLDPASIRMTKSGLIAFNYSYSGSWLLNNKIKSSFQLPVPFNLPLLKTALWLKCTDQSPNHQNDAFYWYYWDPSRKECDQKQGPHYQIASFTVKEANSLERQSYPDYAKLIRSVGVDKTMKMTFAFGHITKPEVSDPFTDTDYNIQTFRKFIEQMRVTAKILNLKETPILQSEYMDAPRPEQQIGARFLGMKNGVQVEIKVVASGDIEPIQLFAQSYAHHHDGFFAWFGHSQVGSEWEAQQFENLVLDYPEYYSLSKDYQIIYWAGCTSYTYYTSRFFKMKAALDPENDPNGTKALDIVSNGFSTQFLPYYLNAMTWFGSLINWEMQTSYQAIVDDLEQASTAAGRVVLVNVLGDEDNPKTAEY